MRDLNDQASAMRSETARFLEKGLRLIRSPRETCAQMIRRLRIRALPGNVCRPAVHLAPDTESGRFAPAEPVAMLPPVGSVTPAFRAIKEARRMKVAGVLGVLMLWAFATARAPVAHAASIPGPHTAWDSVVAHYTDTWRVPYAAGERGLVTVRGDGDALLELRVYDPRGHLMGFDSGQFRECVVSFTASIAGTYRVAVRNTGGIYVNYVYAHN